MSEYVPVNISKELHKKGFKERCSRTASLETGNMNMSRNYGGVNIDRVTKGRIPLPTYDEVVKWFRENHNIIISCDPSLAKSPSHTTNKSLITWVPKCITVINDNFIRDNILSYFYYDKYYDALGKGIEEALKQI